MLRSKGLSSFVVVLLCSAFAPLYGAPACDPEPGLTVVSVSPLLAADEVVSFADGNIAHVDNPDATVFSTTWRDHPSGGHVPEFVNNGTYGDSNGVLLRSNAGPATSGQVYVGIHWSTPQTVREVSISRDAIFNHNDRAIGAYAFEYTTEDFTPLRCPDDTVVCDDAANLTPTWCPMGVADAHLSDGERAGARRTYQLPADLEGVRGIRVLTVDNNVIDELEIASDDCSLASPPTLTKLSVSPLRTAGDVPSFADGNVARAPDASHFNSPHRSGHGPAKINDGMYGDSNGFYWRGLGDSGEIYLGVHWSSPQTVREVAIGRDNIFDHNDRAGFPSEFQYTTDDFTPVPCGASGTPCDDTSQTSVLWCAMGVTNEHNSDAERVGARRRYTLPDDITGVRGVRVIGAAEGLVDELEIGDTPGSLALPIVCDPAPGLVKVTVIPVVAAAGDVPSFADGNVARGPDASPFNSPHRSGHGPAMINNGMYGDSNGFYWRGLGDSGEIYLGVHWSSPKNIREVAIGRDAIFEPHNDRANFAYEFQYTLEDFTPVACGASGTPCDDTSQTSVTWCPMDVVNDHNTDGERAGARRRYALPEELGGVYGVRVIGVAEGLVDELEVGDSGGALAIEATCPGAPGLSKLSVSPLLLAQDVPSFEDGNVARAPNASPFNSPHRSGHGPAFINDGMYGDSKGFYWRGLGDSGEIYLGVHWDTGQTVREVAIGRDNIFDHNNRAGFPYVFEYTTDDFTPVPCGASGTPCDDTSQTSVQWCPMGVANEHLSDGERAGARRTYTLPADLLFVRGVRVIGAAEGLVDELEVGDSVGSLFIEKIFCDPIDLVHVETGGPFATPADMIDVPTFADGNVALAPDATVFHTTYRSGHDPTDAVNGTYGDSSIIFFRGMPTTSGQVYVGVYWTDTTKDVAELAVGRDNTAGHANLVSANYTFQYTTDEFTPHQCGSHLDGQCDDAANLAPVWCPINASVAPSGASPELRRRYVVCPPLEGVRAVRVLTSGVETMIDEFEIGATLGSLGTTPSASLTLRETGGPFTTPAAADDVPSTDEGNLALGGTPFASSQDAATLNDGVYGNAGGGGGGGAGITVDYAGIYLGDTAQEVSEIAFGRDNTGVQNDLADGVHTIQSTQDVFDPTDSGAVEGAAWEAVGCLSFEADAHVGSDCAGIRRRYALESPIDATAVRVVTAQGNIFDEIEVGTITAFVELGDPLESLGETGPSADTDVPSFGDGNLARAPDAVPISSSHDDRGHGPDQLNNGLYGDNNGWQTTRRAPPFDPNTGLNYVGIYWSGGTQTVSQIAIGRDSVGNHTNRHAGNFVVQYTTEEFAISSGVNEPGVAAVKWIEVGTLTAHLDNAAGDTPAGIHSYLYQLDPPVEARAVRALTRVGNHVDELEFYGAPEPVAFARGDANGDLFVDIADAVRIFNHLFAGGPPLPCMDAADSDGTGAVEGALDLTTGIYLLDWLFLGGPAPPAPNSCEDTILEPALGCAEPACN